MTEDSANFPLINRTIELFESRRIWCQLFLNGFFNAMRIRKEETDEGDWMNRQRISLGPTL